MDEQAVRKIVETVIQWDPPPIRTTAGKELMETLRRHLDPGAYIDTGLMAYLRSAITAVESEAFWEGERSRGA